MAAFELSSCTFCPPGNFSGEGWTDCEQCPAGRFTASQAPAKEGPWGGCLPNGQHLPIWGGVGSNMVLQAESLLLSGATGTSEVSGHAEAIGALSKAPTARRYDLQ